MSHDPQPRRIDARVGHTRISRGPIRGPIPLHAFIMKIDGQERLIKKAWGVESADSRRILSGRHNVLIMVDLAEMQGTEDWYGYEMPPEEARKLGASLIAIADEIDPPPARVPPEIQAMADMSVLGHLFQRNDAITAQDFLAAAAADEDDEDSTGPKWTDDDEARLQEAEYEDREAQRQADHDEAIANDTTEGDLFYYPDPMEDER